MKKVLPLLFLVVLLFLVSCASGSDSFSVDTTTEKADIRTISGQLYYSGYYLPSDGDSVTVSLVSSKGLELSSQKMLNIHKFPIGYVVRYDFSEIEKNEDYSIVAVISSADGEKTVACSITLEDQRHSLDLTF